MKLICFYKMFLRLLPSRKYCMCYNQQNVSVNYSINTQKILCDGLIYFPYSRFCVYYMSQQLPSFGSWKGHRCTRCWCFSFHLIILLLSSWSRSNRYILITVGVVHIKFYFECMLGGVHPLNLNNEFIASSIHLSITVCMHLLSSMNFIRRIFQKRLFDYVIRFWQPRHK